MTRTNAPEMRLDGARPRAFRVICARSHALLRRHRAAPVSITPTDPGTATPYGCLSVVTHFAIYVVQHLLVRDIVFAFNFAAILERRVTSRQENEGLCVQ